MDVEDPIQQLLKNTGWSCDDLLEKLQKYKGQKEPNKVEATKVDDQDSVDPDEGIVDSTGEIAIFDIPKVQTLEPKETIETPEVNNEKASNVPTNNRIESEDFSDTDEEEVEVNVTNSNIINEIIDEISTGETEETRDRNDNIHYQTEEDRDNEATEVTEVRVIQVNTDDEEDDCFIEESPQNVANPDEIINKFDYLETYPRDISTILNRPLINKPNCNEETKPEEEEDVSRDINKQDTYSNEKETNKDLAIDCETSEKKLTEETALQDLVAKANKETPKRINSKLQSDFAQTFKKTIGTKTNLPDLDIERHNLGNNKDCENVEEISPSENLQDVQDNSTLQLEFFDTQKEMESATENLVDPLDLGVEDNETDVEKSTSENLEAVQNKLQFPPKETELTENIIDFSSVDMRGNETHDMDDEDESSSTNLEDIRNNLKLQLNSLRTRKKGHFLQELRSRVADVKEYNKKVVSSCEKEDNVNNVDKSNETVCEASENKTPSGSPNGLATGSDILNDKLYTQTNEFGLVILNVQGGIDMDECDDESGTGFNDSNSSQNDVEDEPNNGVLDEIRKIIRKQKVNTLNQNEKTDAIFNSKPKQTIDNFVFFSGSSEREAAEGKTNKCEKGRNADTSAEDSSSSFVVEDQTIDKNSPFVSNTLDEFLTGNSKLNISYNVPKCEAEDGLIETYHEESPLLLKKVVKFDKERSPKPKKTKIIKAKTLAQKRKMLEKQRLKQMKNKKPTPEQHLNNHTVKLEKPIAKKNSFVMINEEKIWVKATTPATCIAKIKTKKTTPDKVEPVTRNNQPQRKPSLLTDLGKKIKAEFKYRPGPMCKKTELQISGNDNWKTETKTLPKILLEITPKIGQPIPPNILSRLPQSDGKLKDNQIEFALSVLKTKTNADCKPKTFVFPLKYKKNQENILVRKQKISPIKKSTAPKCNEQKSVDSVVANVIDDLITYVEIKEIAPSLIKDEEKTRDTVADDKFAKMPVIADNVSSIFKKPQKKRSKVELELFRLSCKVVNVEVEEHLTGEVCSKPYCRLGCVCNSLKCDRLLTYHCGRVQCMLDCKCPKEKSLMYDKVTLPAGTDILSNDAVSRIEDEAKKDLAKVEREFTQTVIHTNDKTIVVGLGGRHKSKRTTKTPKKYSDYVDSIEVVKEVEKEKVVDKSDFFKKCVVSLQNLNLSGIIPFCLTHHLYDCHCNGMSFCKSDDALAKLDTSDSSEPIVIEDDEEIIKTYPSKYNKKTRLRNEMEQAESENDEEARTKQNYDPIKHSKNIDAGLKLARARAVTLKASVAELMKKKFVNKKRLKNHKNKMPELKMFNYVERIADNKKYDNSKAPHLEPAETYEEADIEEVQRMQTPGPTTLKTLKVLRPVRRQEEEEETIMNKQTTKKSSKKTKQTQEKEDSESSSVSSPAEGMSSNGRPVRNVRKITLKEDFSYSTEVSFFTPEDCARVRGIPRHVLNNYKSAVKRNKKPFLKHDFINNITEAELLKSKINNTQDSRQMLEVDLLKKHLIDESLRQKQAMAALVENSYTHKRKQTLEVRNDENSPKVSFARAIQRRKRPGVITQKNGRIESVFEGEIIIDSRNMELLRKMGPKTVSDGYARLLPWKALTESFRDGTIKIWSMVNMPSRLLINKSDKLPPKNYINITQTANPTEVIMWILRNQLPSSYRSEHVSFILKQTKDHYEICGLCTKNFNEDIFAAEASNKNLSEDDTVVEQVKDGVSPFPHKDLYGVSHLLYIKKDKFKLQELIEENLAAIGETSVEKNRLYMWAALPEVCRAGKWRVIFLNSDFTYLYFTKLKYSIKYTDLVSMASMAKSSSSTIMLRNPEIQQAYYTHVNFGIYFDPHYQERIFIGPYSKVFSGDDIETLRYINKSLVCNESFHKMIGKTDYRCGHWLIERPYKRQLEQTIDLTHESNQSPEKRLRYEKSNKEERVVITHNKEQIKVIDGTPRKPEDFNRYIITNIPHFGYLGAYKHDNSNEIDVSWPFENKLLRFPTVNSAIEFLQERFSSLLQPIPETFKISVIVLTQIDLANSQPVNASILSGHYICGDFGFYNVKHISHEDCVNIVGMTRVELLRIFAKRAQAFVRKKIEELAELLNIEMSELGRYDIVNILDMAQKEIDTLKETEKFNVATKNDLLLQKRELALKVICNISELPEKDQRWEHLKFRKTLRRMTLNNEPKEKMEPIVIPDSDEEECASTSVTSDAKDLISQEEPQEKIVNVDSPEPKSTLLPDLPVPEAHKVRTQGGHMVSLLYNNKNLPTKVTETASAFPQLRKLKLKSVLKPISNISATTSLSRVERPILPKEPNIDLTTDGANQKVADLKSVKPQFLTGVKIVKTNSGKFMLVSDNNDKKPFKLPDMIKGTKIVIKNNKILSVKSIEADDVSASEPPVKKVKIYPSPLGKKIVLSRRSLDSIGSEVVTKPCINENEGVEKDTAAVPSEPKSAEAGDRDCEQCNSDYKQAVQIVKACLLGSQKTTITSRRISDAASSNDNIDTAPESNEATPIEADNKGCEQDASEPVCKKVDEDATDVPEKDTAADSNEVKPNDNKDDEQNISASETTLIVKACPSPSCEMTTADRSIVDATSSDNNLDTTAESTDIKSIETDWEQSIPASELTLQKICPSQKVVASKSTLDTTSSNDSLDTAAESNAVESIEAGSKRCEPGTSGSTAEPTFKTITLSPSQSQKVAASKSISPSQISKNTVASKSILDATSSKDDLDTAAGSEVKSIEASSKRCEPGTSSAASGPNFKTIQLSPSQSQKVAASKSISPSQINENTVASKSILDATSSKDDLDIAAGSEVKSIEASSKRCEPGTSSAASEPTFKTIQLSPSQSQKVAASKSISPSHISKNTVASKSILDATSSKDDLDIAAGSEVKSIEASSKKCEPGTSSAASEPTFKTIQLSPSQSQKIAASKSISPSQIIKNTVASKSILDATSSKDDLDTAAGSEVKSIEASSKRCEPGTSSAASEPTFKTIQLSPSQSQKIAASKSISPSQIIKNTVASKSILDATSSKENLDTAAGSETKSIEASSKRCEPGTSSAASEPTFKTIQLSPSQSQKVAASKSISPSQISKNTVASKSILDATSSKDDLDTSESNEMKSIEVDSKIPTFKRIKLSPPQSQKLTESTSAGSDDNVTKLCSNENDGVVKDPTVESSKAESIKTGDESGRRVSKCALS